MKKITFKRCSLVHSFIAKEKKSIITLKQCFLLLLTLFSLQSFAQTDTTNPITKAKNVSVQLDASGSATINTTQADNNSTDGSQKMINTFKKISI